MPETVSLKLPARLSLIEIDEAAFIAGMNRNAFITRAVEFYMGFDPDLVGMLERYAAMLRLPESLVAQNILIRRFAEVAALAEVRGADAAAFDEFRLDANGLKTGKALFDELKARFTREERARLFDEMAKSEDATGERLRRIEKVLRAAGIPEDEAEALKAAVVWAARNQVKTTSGPEAADVPDPGDGPGGKK
ncbi:MAG: hypothetical protein GX493_06170 [Firmicutes bacterium]|nr:hypothetical protein [Bacillota bacterium]